MTAPAERSEALDDRAEPATEPANEEVDLEQQWQRLRAGLRELDSLLVAFSAGADSALLLAAAARALGTGKVAAATGVSASLADGELEQAAGYASWLGVELIHVRTEELSRPGYRANAGDRCFHCKAELLDRLGPIATERGLRHVATGTNLDDVRAGFRPGIRAAAERGAVTPLRDAGFTKADVRALSRRWGLPTWDKPAAACLSSRIAYGVEITPRRLARVDTAEQAVRQALQVLDLTVIDLRVRDLGDGAARIELDPDLLERMRPDERDQLSRAALGVGFDSVQIERFRSGSMNELLAEPQRYR